MKILLALLALAALTSTASAQSRNVLRLARQVVGRSATDSSGNATNYDARVVSRESTSGNRTTIYDAGGRNVGRYTTSR